MSAVTQLSTQPESNVGFSEIRQATPETTTYMVSPHVGPDQEEDITFMAEATQRKYPRSAYPDVRGGVYFYYETNTAKSFMNLLELQGFAYDMTFLPNEH